MNEYFGKYRGKVINNVDPRNCARLQVEVPAVLGEGRQSWALPCSPYAGAAVGFFALPPVGANIWVEFEAGDPDYPIWSGCFWSEGELPSVVASAGSRASKNIICLQTSQASIVLDDRPNGGLTIESRGLKIMFNDSGIEIDNGRGGTIVLNNNQVSINGDALEVS